MPEQTLEKNQKKPLTKEVDLLSIYTRQIKDLAYELQYGELVIKFKVRDGEVKEAHKIQESIKLRPF